MGESTAETVREIEQVRGRLEDKLHTLEEQPPATVLRVEAPRWLERSVRDGSAAKWAAAAGGTWVLLRLAEIRQLRRMNRALLASRG